MYRNTAAIVLVILTCAASATFAQSAQSEIPTTVDPGRIEQRFEPFKTPKSDSEAIVPGERDLIAPAGANDLTFYLTDIVIDGTTVVDPDTLRSIYQDRLANEATLATLYDIANDITAFYRNKGFVLSQAVVPEQEVDENGVVTIQVIEGYVKNITIVGPEDKYRPAIERYVDFIKQSVPLRADALERSLLLVTDFSGVQAVATLSPSDSPGAADLQINATLDQVESSVNINNRGNDFQGPVLYQLVSSINGLTRRLNSLQLYAYTTLNNELTQVGATHVLPVGDQGLAVDTSISHTSSQPAGDLAPLEIDSDSFSLSLSARYPLIRARRENLSGHVTVDTYDSESERLADTPGAEDLVTEDSIRAIRAGGTYDRLDRFGGLNLADVTVSQGLDVAGAEGNSRIDGETAFTKIESYVARLQSIAPRWSLFGAINGQYSDDNLLSREQFGVGGRDFGAAFDSSEIIGDSGIAGRLELRYTHGTVGRLIRGAVLYTFLDGGEIKRNDPGADQSSTESLSSAGLGLRFSLIDLWDGYLEYASPLSNEIQSEGNDDPRFFFSVKKTF